MAYLNKKNNIHPGTGITISYKGVFNVDSLYKSIKSWYFSNSYDYYEKENTEKNKPQGNTLQLKLNGERDVDDYVQFKIEVEFNEINELKKVKKGYSGNLRGKVRAFMVLDHHNKWENIPFLFYLYNNLILKKKILGYYWGKIEGEMMDLNHTIKSELGLVK